MFGKLIANGCPAGGGGAGGGAGAGAGAGDKAAASAHFRELCMHGSIGPVKALAASADVHAVESTSGRSALHKGAFWGHVETVQFLVAEQKLNVNQQDFNGDTPLHDAARFGHKAVCDILVGAGADRSITNNMGKNAQQVASDYGKAEVAAALGGE